MPLRQLPARILATGARSASGASLLFNQEEAEAHIFPLRILRGSHDSSNNPTFVFMKIAILVTGGLLALVVSVWCVKHMIDTKEGEPSQAPLSDSATETVAPLGVDSHVGDTAASLKNPLAVAPAPNLPPPLALPTSQQSEPPPAQYTLSSSPPRPHPGNSPSPRLSNGPPVQEASPGRGAGSTLPPAAVSSSGRWSAPIAAAAGSAAPSADQGSIELAPGVPAPAALMPADGTLPPAAAAAQQHIADSFVEGVHAAINQPGTTDAAAGKIYDQSLSAANEQYRALFGNAAYNSASVKAGIDAQAGE